MWVRSAARMKSRISVPGKSTPSVDITKAVSRAMAVTPLMIKLVNWLWSRFGAGRSALSSSSVSEASAMVVLRVIR